MGVEHQISHMRPVSVVGIGKTPFGAFPDRDLRSLAVEAGEKCLKNAHVAASQVDAFFLGNFAGPSFVGQNRAGTEALPVHVERCMASKAGVRFFFR